MSTQLYFIYDSHCPWSYAASGLIEQVAQKLPQINIHYLHACYYDGQANISKKTVDSVIELSEAKFGVPYLNTLDENKDATVVANVMAWSQQKSPKDSLSILTAIQEAHFIDGNAMNDGDNVEAIVNSLKLSVPSKSLRSDKLSKDAEYLLHDIEEIQDIIGTESIPALLLAHNDELILLNHNLYLSAPEAIIEAITAEIT